MKAYKNKLKRDIVGSGMTNTNFGVYVTAIRNYYKGEEVFIGNIKQKDRELFDKLLKLIK